MSVIPIESTMALLNTEHRSSLSYRDPRLSLSSFTSVCFVSLSTPTLLVYLQPQQCNHF